MPVPPEVDSIREQIKEAIKLSLEDAGICTFMSLDKTWGSLEGESDYPAGKIWYSTSSLDQEYMGSKDRRNSPLLMQIAPYSRSDDWELITSKIVEQFPKHVLTDTVREFMDDTYKPFLGKITVQGVDTPETDLKVPYAVVNATIDVQYVVP